MGWERVGVFPNRIEADHFCNSRNYGQFDRNYTVREDGTVEVFIKSQALNEDYRRSRFTGVDNRGRWE